MIMDNLGLVSIIMPVYNVLGIIPAVCGMSNKIVVMER